jgi:tRNA pseudouridine38-40 synthase
VNIEAMNEAATLLQGFHNFAAFCRPRDYGTTIRTLLHLAVNRRCDATIDITAEADAFCHSMVRSLVGALVTIGRGQRDLDWIQAHLKSTVRGNDITVMPAHGLTLEEVIYPPDNELMARAEQTRTLRCQEDS